MSTNILQVTAIGLFAACASAATQASVAHAAPEAAPLAACEGSEIQGDGGLTRYASCSTITGDLVVRGATDLSALGNVRSITGSLWIRDTSSLESLSGLERLESVPVLMLTHNQILADVSALAHLRQADSVIVIRNPDLESLDGMSGLSSLCHLTLVSNGLTSLEGLDHLRSIEHVTIARNARPLDIAALVAGHPKIDRDPALALSLK